MKRYKKILTREKDRMNMRPNDHKITADVIKEIVNMFNKKEIDSFVFQFDYIVQNIITDGIYIVRRDDNEITLVRDNDFYMGEDSPHDSGESMAVMCAITNVSFKDNFLMITGTTCSGVNTNRIDIDMVTTLYVNTGEMRRIYKEVKE